MNDLDRQLLVRFPTFDPNWPENTKRAWYAAFDELMKQILAKPAKKVRK